MRVALTNRSHQFQLEQSEGLALRYVMAFHYVA